MHARAQVAAAPDATVEGLATELAKWDAEYHASAAAAGPAKWRLRQEFVAGTYAALLRSVQERQAAAERARASDADRRLREVRAAAAACTVHRACRGDTVCACGTADLHAMYSSCGPCLLSHLGRAACLSALMP
jgi:hypothetical protein